MPSTWRGAGEERRMRGVRTMQRFLWRWALPEAMADALAVAIGTALMLVVRGYQFGQSNHNVYLLEPLRECCGFLQRDWFTTQTLQYHGAFTWVCTELKIGRAHV